jgi:hypothetical protein
LGTSPIFNASKIKSIETGLNCRSFFAFIHQQISCFERVFGYTLRRIACPPISCHCAEFVKTKIRIALMQKALKRTRAPGAGRPRKAEADKKASAFTTRITAETRRALEASARKHRRSLSQEAEAGLRDYLKKPAGEAHNRAIAAIIFGLAERIEQQTGKSWQTDVFTSMALRYAVDAVLVHVAPGTEENPAIPPAVEKHAAKMGEFADRYRRPAGLGHMRAYSLIDEIESRPRAGEKTDEWTTPIFMNASQEMIDLLAKDLDLE